MRQPVRFDQPDPESIRYARLPVPIHRRHTVRPPRRAPRRDTGMTDSTAVRAFLAFVAVVLIAILAYLLTLSSRPTFSGLGPAPNEETPPGVVTVQATVNAAHPIQEVRLMIDGERVAAGVIPTSDRNWKVRYQAVLAKGSHTAEIVVVDTTGTVQQHSWTFASSGARVPPAVEFAGAPPGASFAQGLIRLVATATSDAPVESATMTINGEPFPVTVAPVASATLGTQAAHTQQSWEISGERAFSIGTYSARLTVTNARGDEAYADWLFRVADAPAKATARYFSTSRVIVYGPFKTFWETHDGPRLFGNPVSPRVIGENGSPVQYFERARFELGPDNQVGLGLLGIEAYQGKRESITKPNNLNGRYFPETGHTLTGKFQEFWEKNGGLPIFGFPITEVIDEEGTKVQYFERARLELIGGSGDATTVEITPLGTQLWAAKNGSR